MSNQFNKRVFGCAIIKSLNSNYNADFSHQPRTLPNGTVYATDKALKYSVRNYWMKVESTEKVLYFKRYNENMNPYDLDEAYDKMFPEDKTGTNKATVLKNLLSCIDVKTFGATYANKKKKIAVSIHGPVQITHGVNKFIEGFIYSEQIMSPFRDDKKSKEKKDDKDDKAEGEQKEASTLGTQSKLQEGHYVHHFSVNPKNIEEDVKRVQAAGLTDSDIEKLKEGLRRGATYYDSAAKAGTENELLLWVQLKEGSKAVLPSFVELVKVNITPDEGREIDLTKIKELLAKDHIQSEIEKIELYFQKGITKVVNAPEGAEENEL